MDSSKPLITCNFAMPLTPFTYYRPFDYGNMVNVNHLFYHGVPASQLFTLFLHTLSSVFVILTSSNYQCSFLLSSYLCSQLFVSSHSKIKIFILPKCQVGLPSPYFLEEPLETTAVTTHLRRL